ncbi:phosducin [Nakaseomyces glabratus]|nr:phosducin [Nakaseomyces glabratus]KAH7581901.1 phosducin [Nakaseomyces glabratus]KAI8393129.1 phosducin [Nakaseomyces glabratus]KTB22510.1 Phosducin-like protein 2 [Nakaseomyces glabratus]KTB26493.1 Phosducin-like protein 2 [Nakaseomyces glabratus]
MQNEPMFQVQVDESEDTEWNDILRSKGIIPERPPSPTQQIEEALDEAIAKQHANRLEGKDLSDLEDLEDEEDEEFLEIYKKKRMAEMAKLRERSKFGDVYHINKPEYNKEVTLASKGLTHELADDEEHKREGDKDNSKAVYVFVHLSLHTKIQSRILDHLFQASAKKFPEVKFVEIPANRAIENYPENNCPTLIVYHNGDVIKNIVTLLELGGNNTTIKDFEKLIVDCGAVSPEDKRLVLYDEGYEDKKSLHFADKKSIRTGYASNMYADDEDDDFFD